MRIIDADALLETMMATDRYFMIKFDIERAPTVDLWHYPEKGELPDKDGEYFITVKTEGGFINALALYYVDKGWLGIFNKPYAWQYITQPKVEHE